MLRLRSSLLAMDTPLECITTEAVSRACGELLLSRRQELASPPPPTEEACFKLQVVKQGLNEICCVSD